MLRSSLSHQANSLTAGGHPASSRPLAPEPVSTLTKIQKKANEFIQSIFSRQGLVQPLSVQQQACALKETKRGTNTALPNRRPEKVTSKENSKACLKGESSIGKIQSRREEDFRRESSD